MHALGKLLATLGAITYLDRLSERYRLAHWLRSLFCIHDFEALVALDVPWWSYGAIREVDRILMAKADARVFEFGSGASTIWLARRAGSVTSVEHHAGWYQKVQDYINNTPDLCSVELRLIEPDRTKASQKLYTSAKSSERGQSFEAYANAIEMTNTEKFDVIVIDGRARAACLFHAKRMLAEDGAIVFDNSGRGRYRRPIKESGLCVRQYRGLTPSLPYMDQTTLLSFEPPAG